MSGHDVEAIVAAISPLLAGHDPGVQGAALADLLAMWLAATSTMPKRGGLDDQRTR